MNTTEIKQLRGWIQPCDPETSESAARVELETLGVDVGPWHEKIEEFQNCIVSREAMDKLDPLWGRYIWGLQ